MILGTAAYMSPEQARGKTVDKRADIWAFGVVLHEMLTGRPAFAGDTITDIIAAVVTREPDWIAIPATTPASIRQLLARCLEKDPKRRLRDIGEARFALESGQPSSGASDMSSAMGPTAPLGTSPQRPWLWMAAAAVFAVTTICFAATSWRARGSAPTADSFELAIAPPAGAEFHLGDNFGNVILSPNGTTIAFVATTSKVTTLWVRSLATDDARALPGTRSRRGRRTAER
jgi:serine/threonine protein kinase